jgi:hypothetical protein
MQKFDNYTSSSSYSKPAQDYNSLKPFAKNFYKVKWIVENELILNIIVGTCWCDSSKWCRNQETERWKKYHSEGRQYPKASLNIWRSSIPQVFNRVIGKDWKF